MLRRFGSASLGLALACSQTAMAATRVVPGASLGADACGWQEQVPAEYHGVNAYLNAISADNKNDVWAVGYENQTGSQGSGPLQTLVEHWDGSKWNTSTAVNGLTETQFTAVAALLPTDVWAVGWYNS